MQTIPAQLAICPSQAQIEKNWEIYLWNLTALFLTWEADTSPCNYCLLSIGVVGLDGIVGIVVVVVVVVVAWSLCYLTDCSTWQHSSHWQLLTNCQIVRNKLADTGTTLCGCANKLRRKFLERTRKRPVLGYNQKSIWEMCVSYH